MTYACDNGKASRVRERLMRELTESDHESNGWYESLFSPDYSLAVWALAPVELLILLEPDASAFRLIDTLYFDVLPQPHVNSRGTLISFNTMKNLG